MKSEKKNGLSENEKKIQKEKRTTAARYKIFSLFEKYQCDPKNEELQSEIQKILDELMD